MHYLYYIKIKFENKIMYKIGRSSNLQSRFMAIRKLLNLDSLELLYVEGSHDIANIIEAETIIKRLFKGVGLNGRYKTEIFNTDILKELYGEYSLDENIVVGKDYHCILPSATIIEL